MPATRRSSSRSRGATSTAERTARSKSPASAKSPPPNKPVPAVTNPPLLYLLFLSTFICCAFTQGGTPVAYAHYILHFSTLSSYHTITTTKTTFTPRKLFLALTAICAVSSGLVMAGSLPLKGPAIPLLFLYSGLQLCLPAYLTHYVTTSLPLTPLQTELLLPTFAVVTEYVHARIFPYSSYGILPYTQYGQTATMQLASIGGVWLIEFFVAFIASAAATTFNNPTASNGSAKRMVLVFAVVQFFGGARLRLLSWEGSTNAPNVPNMRVAGVWVPHTMVVREHLLRHHLGHLVDGRKGPGDSWDSAGWVDVRTWASEDLKLAEVEIAREAAAGAQLVMFPELCFVAFDGEGVTDDGKVDFDLSKANVVDTLAEYAIKHNVWVGAGVGTNEPFKMVEGLSKFTDVVLEKGGAGMVGVEANRFMLFPPTAQGTDGSAILDYFKKNPVAIIEKPFGVAGNSSVPVTSVALGSDPHSLTRVGSVICFDMENPWHVKQLGLTTDVILNPSYDWPGLNPYHARIVAFRAIETGSTVFHHCLAGTTVAVDYLGNVLSSSDYFSKNNNGGQSCVPEQAETRCNPPVNVAQLPLAGVATVYGVIGDSLVYLCAVVGGWVVAMARRRRV